MWDYEVCGYCNRHCQASYEDESGMGVCFACLLSSPEFECSGCEDEEEEN